MGHTGNWAEYPTGSYAQHRLYVTQTNFKTHLHQNIQYYFSEAAEGGNPSGLAQFHSQQDTL